MSEIKDVVVQSVIEAPIKHSSGLLTTGTGVATGDIIGIIAASAGILVSIILFVKTYKEIKLLNIKLAKEDRRKSDS